MRKCRFSYGLRTEFWVLANWVFFFSFFPKNIRRETVTALGGCGLSGFGARSRQKENTPLVMNILRWSKSVRSEEEVVKNSLRLIPIWHFFPVFPKKSCIFWLFNQDRTIEILAKKTDEKSFFFQVFFFTSPSIVLVRFTGLPPRHFLAIAATPRSNVVKTRSWVLQGASLSPMPCECHIIIL